jgi:hypothetical protein
MCPKSNVIMTCNWLTGRGKFSVLGEESDLYVPPSGALAGKIYSTLMSQVTAGKKFGVLSGVDGVKFELKKTEIANLEKMGLVPMVRDYGKVMAFSAKTLFNGDNLGLQTYSVVRVFDYVSKVLIDFLNRRAFENFNSNTRKELMSQIVTFMDTITGPDKLIEDFNIRRFEQDSVQKDRIHLDIHMKPYFPAKNFLIRMEGQKSDEGITGAQHTNRISDLTNAPFRQRKNRKMGKPAARLTDMHTCPMVTPGLPPIPHVGGPIVGPGAPTY